MKTFYEMMKILETQHLDLDPADSAEKEFEIRLASKNPVTFEDATTGRPIPHIPGSESVVGGDGDRYSIHIRVLASGRIGYKGEMRDEVIETDGVYIQNNTTGKYFGIPSGMESKIVSKEGDTPYVAETDPYEGELNLSLRPRAIFAP